MTNYDGYDVTYTVLTPDRTGMDGHPTTSGASVRANEPATYVSANYSEF